MAFMERMGDTLLSMGKDVSQKAKDMSGIAKLKLNIRSKEDFVKEQYMEIVLSLNLETFLVLTQGVALIA